MKLDLFKASEGCEDPLGGAIEGGIAGAKIGKFVFLLIAGLGLVLFYVLKFLLPYIIKLLAVLVPILWAGLLQICRWIAWVVECGIAALKSIADKQQNPADKSAH